MAHNEDIDRIRLESTVERVRKYKITEMENRTKQLADLLSETLPQTQLQATSKELAELEKNLSDSYEQWEKLSSELEAELS